MDSTNEMNFDLMSTSMENNMSNGYATDNNNDLNMIFDGSDLAASNNAMFDFGSGFTPNYMKVPSGINVSSDMNGPMGMGGAFPANAMYQQHPSHGRGQYETQTSGFPFPRQQQVNPAVVMGSDGDQGAKRSHEDFHEQSPEPVFNPKPKRTRKSKKQPRTQAEEDEKREIFLERNRLAAHKCRRRKQDQNHALQETHTRLVQENDIMQHIIRELQGEVAQLKATLLGHHASGGCLLPEQLEAQVAQFEPTNMSRSVSAQSNVSFGTAQSAYSMPMGRINSAMSYTSSRQRPAYKPNGDADLMSPHLPDYEIKRLRKEQDAQSEAYMVEYRKTHPECDASDMSRQNSNASRLSNMSGTTSGKESGHTSAITTPEGEKFDSSPKITAPPTASRRGRPRKSFENPRSLVDPSLEPKFDGLMDLQSPAEFLAKQ